MSCPSGWDATDSHCMRTRPVCCRLGDRLDGNRGQRSGLIRLLGVHAALATSPQRSLGHAVSDTVLAFAASDYCRRRQVSSPSTPAGGRATRRAHETHPGALQLLWREWQRSQFGAAGRRHGAALVHVASPSKQPHASHLAEVRCVVGTISSARASDSRANLGRIAMSHISGRAGWWKPPSPVLVRTSGEQSPGATRKSKLAPSAPTRRFRHRSIANDSGRPSSVIRLSTLHARTDSTACAARVRLRSRSPRIDLYRKNAFSTRACR